MQYEEIVEKFCGRNWSNSPDERNAGIGVACVLAFIEGTEPKIEDIAKTLKMKENDIEPAMNNLLANGIFGKYFNAKKDPVLLGQKTTKEAEIAWCYIAGIAGGFTGLREN